jgi:predicted nucleotidyltransferase component of viral defense system
MYSEAYKNQFTLLLKILPCLRDQDHFVIKGGTAINLFYRDFPRISVDIDLTYTAIESRDLTIKHMSQGLRELELLINKRLPNSKINKQLSKNREYITKVMVSDGNSIVKIEPNYIFRGHLFDATPSSIVERVTEEFGAFIDNVPVASFCDVYAGKICAALSRQHPRDLFDIKLLLENEGLTDNLRQAFVIYLACDARPMNELLNPNRLDISKLYVKEFNRMALIPIELDELLQVRERLIKELLNTLTKNEREFLLSIKQGEPDYSLMPFDHLEQLPALRWKLVNVRKIEKIKRVNLLSKLKAVLDV